MNILKKFWVFGGASLLVVAGAAMPGKFISDFVDPIQYETPTPEYYHEAKAAEDEEPAADVKKVVIHYYNTDKKNPTRQIYTWTTGNDNKYNDMVIDSDDKSGNYYHIELDYTKDSTEYAGKSFLNFIVKYKDTWAGQSLDTLLEFSVYKPDANGLVEVWCAPGTAGAIDIYSSKADTIKAKVSQAYFTDWKTIHCVADEQKEQPKAYRLYAYDKAYLVSSDAVQQRTHNLRLIKEGTADNWDKKTASFDIKFNHTAHVNVQYVVETEYNSHDKVQSIIVTAYKLYGDKNFVQYYNYSGNDLGCTFAQDKTTFKLWAPTAGAVILNIYNKGTPKSLNIKKGDASDIHTSYFMTMQPGGVWEKTLLTTGYDADLPADSLENKYYTYTIYNSEGVNEVCDPYAKACGVNGVRAMILDFSKTNPTGWDKLPLKWDGTARDIKTPQELSIYEIHIRDLTEDKTWGGKERRGTFKAFYEKGTTYTGKDAAGNNATVKTGFDHIEELGVNAIQIMPMFDHDNSESYYYYKTDEEGKPTKEQVSVTTEYVDSHKEELDNGTLQMDFNWGYNPLNYNCIEGSYSSDPRDGAARVKEFKELVMAYANNKNNTRVIMDVVYNHVSSVANTLFTKIMPRYYFRFNEKADAYYDGSGCSNEVKTEAPMMTKYIVDSLCWWASEYKVKGFRFDLMKLLDIDMLNKARQELYKIDPDIYMYGEGWALDYAGPKDKGGDTYNVYAKMNGNNKAVFMGGFNDGGRNAVRGGNDGGWGSGVRTPGWGFISQGSGDVGSKSKEVGMMLTGANSICTYANQDPRQTVNYASCHDNYTLYDQLSWTLSETGGSGTDASKAPKVEDVMRASTAINCAIMTGNGVAFMLGGEELFRNKIEDRPELSRLDEDYVKMYGKCVSHNSYKSSTNCNSFKWDRKVKVTGYKDTAYAGEVSQGKFTNWYMDALIGAINARKEIAKKTPNNNGFCYSSNNKDYNKCNYFEAGPAKTSLGFYMGGYVTVLCGRGASEVSLGAGNKTRVASVGSAVYDSTSGVATMGIYSGAVYKV
ncbi:MAG: hypothetical protein E7178_06590 [Erysipelotrichaceae bacterium]|nr:hypothetical protein [Erysipelotrichaceae bacterium]